MESNQGCHHSNIGQKFRNLLINQCHEEKGNHGKLAAEAV
jgi:hypothetical protein